MYKRQALVDVINAYSSLLVVYDKAIDNIYDEIESLKLVYSNKKKDTVESKIVWKIPVCYMIILAPIWRILVRKQI